MPTEELILRIKHQGVRETKKATDSAANSADRLKAAFDRLSDTSGSSRWSRTRRNIENIEKSIKNTERSVSLLTRAFRGLFALHVAGRIFDVFKRIGLAIAETADSYTLLQNRIRAVATAQSQVGQITKELFDVSIRSRSTIQETATAYSRMAVAAKDLGISQADAARITETLVKTVKLSGTATQEGEKALIQFTQAVSSNRLSADELRSVTEQLPRLADIIAKHLGVTRGSLKALGESGKLTTEVMVEALKKAADEIDGEFSKLLPTIADSWEVLTTVVKQFVGEIDTASGFSASFSTTLIEMAKNLRTAITPFRELTEITREFAEEGKNAAEAQKELSDKANQAALTTAKLMDIQRLMSEVFIGPSVEESLKPGNDLLSRLQNAHKFENAVEERQRLRAEKEAAEALLGPGVGLDDFWSWTPNDEGKRKRILKEPKGRKKRKFSFEDAMKEITQMGELENMRKADREADTTYLRLKKRLTEEITVEQQKQLSLAVRQALNTDKKVELEIQEEIIDSVKEQAARAKSVNDRIEERIELLKKAREEARKEEIERRKKETDEFMGSATGQFNSPWLDVDKDGNIGPKHFKTWAEHLGEFVGPDGIISQGIDQMNAGLAETVAHGIVFNDTAKEWNENLKNVARTIQMQLLTGLLSLPGQIATDAIKNAVAGGVSSSTNSAIGRFGADVTVAALKGHKSGGYTGNYGVNNIAGYVHGQEFVMPAEQTRKFRSDLESMKAGRAPGSKSSGVNMQVNVINQAGGNIEFESKAIDEKTIEIIAKRQVEKHAEKVVAGAISDPYSRTSKALGRHTNTRRNR